MSLDLPTTEVWKDVPGYEGLYQVSNLGRVKSVQKSFIRSNGRMMELNERILKQSVSAKGYLAVKLYRVDGKKSFPVHRLVAFTFLEAIKGKNQVNHINGIKTDNLLSNLEFVDQWENMNHLATKINKKPRGVQFHNNKWQSRIVHDAKCINLGHFSKKSDAYKAYYEKFIEFRGIEPWDLKIYKTH